MAIATTKQFPLHVTVYDERSIEKKLTVTTIAQVDTINPLSDNEHNNPSL